MPTEYVEHATGGPSAWQSPVDALSFPALPLLPAHSTGRWSLPQHEGTLQWPLPDPGAVGVPGPAYAPTAAPRLQRTTSADQLLRALDGMAAEQHGQHAVHAQQTQHGQHALQGADLGPYQRLLQETEAAGFAARWASGLQLEIKPPIL